MYSLSFSVFLGKQKIDIVRNQWAFEMKHSLQYIIVIYIWENYLMKFSKFKYERITTE